MHTLQEGERFNLKSKSADLGKFSVIIAAGDKALVKQEIFGGVEIWIPAGPWLQDPDLSSRLIIEDWSISICQS